LLASTIFFPLQWQIIHHDDDDNDPDKEPYYYGTCQFQAGVKVDAIQWGSPEQWGSVVFGILSIGNMVALILALVEAFRGRTIVVEYNESRYILMAAVCILQIMLVGLPVLILVQEQYNQKLSYYFACTIIFSTCMSVLLFLFLPKLWAHHHTQKETTTATNAHTLVGLSIQKRFGTSVVSMSGVQSLSTSFRFQFFLVCHRTNDSYDMIPYSLSISLLSIGTSNPTEYIQSQIGPSPNSIASRWN
jgi:hypothetical protein